MNKTINKITISILSIAFALGFSNVSFAAGPVMSTSSTSNITASSATLNGFYNENGSPMTQIYFDYGSTPLLGTLSGFGTISGASGNYSVSISGLTSGTTYYVKAVGVNGNGMTWGNPMISFTTKSVTTPVVTTNSASSITSTTATLNGYFNSANASAQTYFEYGTSSNALINSTPSVSQTNSFGNFNDSITSLLPNTTYYFRAVATNSAGTTKSSMIISFKTSGSVTPTCSINSFTASQMTVTSGIPVTISWNTSNCVSGNISGFGSTLPVSSGIATVYPVSSTSYILTAYDANGTSVTMSIFITVNNNTNSCNIINFNASTNSVISGSPVTISWNTNNCNTVIVSGSGLNSNALNGSQIVYPTFSSTYTITAYGSNGIPITQAVSVNVNNNNNNLNCYISNFSSSTTIVTSNNPVVLTWSTNNCASASISNVGNVPTSGSQLIFPSVSTNYTLTAYGANGAPITQTLFISVNKIIPNPIKPPVIIYGPTVTTNSPIMLKIEDRYEYIGSGDTIDYTVSYKNISNKKLTHPMLQVIVPKNITLTNSSAGTYSSDTNTLSVPLEDLLPKAEGVIYVQGHVDSISSNTAQIVTTAILVYTNPNGAQENAMAYVLNKPKDGGLGLGASAFGSGFLPSTFIGWLLLTVFILLVIMIARMFISSQPSSAVHH